MGGIYFRYVPQTFFFCIYMNVSFRLICLNIHVPSDIAQFIGTISAASSILNYFESFSLKNYIKTKRHRWEYIYFKDSLLRRAPYEIASALFCEHFFRWLEINFWFSFVPFPTIITFFTGGNLLACIPIQLALDVYVKRRDSMWTCGSASIPGTCCVECSVCANGSLM